MKILFIGNSYTYFNDMPSIFAKLANENGQTIEVFSVTAGGHYLRQNLEPGDKCAMQLNALLEQHHFDVCVLQEQSTYPVRSVDGFVADAVKLAGYLAPNVDRFVLYATWGRQIGARFLEENGLTTQSMMQALKDAYEKAAEAITSAHGKPVTVSPVGAAFWQAGLDSTAELYNPDLSHPSYEGSCLAALIHYRTIFGTEPCNTQGLSLPATVECLFRTILSLS